MATKDIDHGRKKILAELKQLKNSQVRVGWIGGAYPEIMFFNEKGTKDIPARPAVASTFDENEAKYLRMVKEGTRDVYAGQATAVQILNEFGITAKGDLQKGVRRWSEPPNAPSTVEKKGFNNPLVETGGAIAAIVYEIEKRKG